jgi:hypothetical protein
MTLRIMFLNVREFGSLLPKCFLIPIQIPYPFMYMWIAAPNISDIGFEVLDIDDIKADNGGV